MTANKKTGTNIDEVARGIYRINTPVSIPGGEFSFNQYLIVDEAPLLFHAGLRRLFPLVLEAIERVMPVERLRYIGVSHFEADECGGLNDWLACAPQAEPVCSRIGAMVSIADIADRAPRAMADGETLSLGEHTVRWFDMPHMPHGWDCGLMMEYSTRTLLCGDLFTQGGAGENRSLKPISSDPAKHFARRWTTLRTPPTPPPSWSALQQSGRKPWPACMATHGVATVQRCCIRWRIY